MQIYTGGSVNSAALMNDKQADICLNWSGMTYQLPTKNLYKFLLLQEVAYTLASPDR